MHQVISKSPCHANTVNLSIVLNKNVFIMLCYYIHKKVYSFIITEIACLFFNSNIKYANVEHMLESFSLMFLQFLAEY